MAYEKKTWECGETITADALNHIEDGIEDASKGGGRVVHVVGGGSCNGNQYEEFDISYAEIVELMANGTPLWMEMPSGDHAIALSLAAYPIDSDVYEVDTTVVINGNMRQISVYSDTEDGNMRNADCWSK